MLKTSLDYYAPASLQEAVDALGHYGERAKVMAGGTDLLIALQKEEINCDTLVDIGKIDEIKEIKKDGPYLVVGAAVPFSSIISQPLVMEAAPLLVQASLEVGSPQIRNRGTIGGNLGTASPAGDLLTPLIALEAEIVVVGLAGRRRTPVDKFLGGGDRERLQPYEIISEVWIPLPGSGETRSAFIKLGRRKALAISRLSLALYLEMQGENIAKARMAVGAAGPFPFRVAGAEQSLVKSGVNAGEIMKQVSREVADSLGDRPSAQYKTIAVKGLVLEALSKCGLV
ncbi:MAG: FAD binding domain-containing protein [Desulfocucumaceae bacterium]